MLLGRCHCSSIQFQMPDQAVASSVCYCGDCRKHSGAPMLAWAMVPKDAVSVTGEPKVYNSSGPVANPQRLPRVDHAARMVPPVPEATP